MYRVKINLKDGTFEGRTGFELSRILHRLADECADGFELVPREIVLKDSLGNVVGLASWVPK